MIPPQTLLDGSGSPPWEPVQLRAGPLTMLFESDSGWLRNIRMGEVEIVRGIYVAVRDRNWGTVAPVLDDLSIEADGQMFRVSFKAKCRRREIEFVWRGIITGDSHGTVQFGMSGQARSDFLRNRIGFCVLHPSGRCAGQPCTIERADGTSARGAFPDFISPHQPFGQMRAISHEVASGLTAEVRMEGDVFEMEDQRNWTDASFKTYCTPLELPYPVQIQAGTAVDQTVTLRLRGSLPATVMDTAASQPEVMINLAEAPSVALPRLGLGMAHHGRPLSNQEASRLRSLALDHLRVDLKLSSPAWMDTLRRAAGEARDLDTSLEAAVLISDDAEAELGTLARELEALKPPIATWLIMHSARQSVSQEHLQLARHHLARHSHRAKLGSGTNAYFAELNRHPPASPIADLVCYSINPQVHAFDNVSLIETLEAQPDTVRSARHLSGGRPVAVTPVTLRPRFNPDATGPEAQPAPGELPSQVDVRQMSLFGAVWTLGSMKALFESGACSVTYYETTGWRGVMETQAGSPWPEPFRSLAGAVFPLYHVFADVAEFHGGHVLAVHSTHPRVVNGLALSKAGRTRMLLGSFSSRPQVVTIGGVGSQCRVRQMDHTNGELAMRFPEQFRAEASQFRAGSQGLVELTLQAYAVACIDIAKEAART